MDGWKKWAAESRVKRVACIMHHRIAFQHRFSITPVVMFLLFACLLGGKHERDWLSNRHGLILSFEDAAGRRYQVKKICIGVKNLPTYRTAKDTPLIKPAGGCRGSSTLQEENHTHQCARIVKLHLYHVAREKGV